MTDREPDSLASLVRAAKQMLRAERDLAGEALPAQGRPLPVADPVGPFEPAPLGAAAVNQPAPINLPAGQPPMLGMDDEAPIVKGGLSAEQKAALLHELDVNEVQGCNRCGLCEAATHHVFGEGNPDADLMFIGEGPGADEDIQGRPFVGRAGQLLDKMIAAMGLKREQVYIGNLVKCRPPGNRTPTPEEIQACWGHLQRQIQIIQPRVIVTLGSPATRTLLHTDIGITKIRGQWQQFRGIPVMPTFHPAYVLRQYSEENRRKVWSDLQAVMDKLGLKKS